MDGNFYTQLGWDGAVRYIDPKNLDSIRLAERLGAKKSGGNNRNGKVQKLEANVRKWQSAADKYKSTIKALKRKGSDDTEDLSDSEPEADAGNAFGGRSEKSKKKKKKSGGS